MQLKKFFASLALVSILASCTNEAGKANKTAILGASGAVAGGMLGSAIGKGSGNTAAIIAGALLGSLAGGALGKSLDDQDLKMMQNAHYDALEHNRSGISSAWRNPDTGASGSIKPIKTFRDNSMLYCREYTHTINVGGKSETAYGKACRQPDGQWKIQNQD